MENEMIGEALKEAQENLILLRDSLEKAYSHAQKALKALDFLTGRGVIPPDKQFKLETAMGYFAAIKTMINKLGKHIFGEKWRALKLSQ